MAGVRILRKRVAVGADGVCYGSRFYSYHQVRGASTSTGPLILSLADNATITIHGYQERLAVIAEHIDAARAPFAANSVSSRRELRPPPGSDTEWVRWLRGGAVAAEGPYRSVELGRAELLRIVETPQEPAMDRAVAAILLEATSEEAELEKIQAAANATAQLECHAEGQRCPLAIRRGSASYRCLATCVASRGRYRGLRMRSCPTPLDDRLPHACAYICAQCGYTEWYTSPEVVNQRLAQLAQHPITGVAFVDSSTPPYR